MRPDRMDNNRQTKKRHNIPKHPPPSRQNAGPIPTRRHHKPLLRITNSRHSRPALSPRHSRKSGNQPQFFVIPAPAYAGAGYGGNQLAAGRRMLRRLCRRELDGDFISPSFSRLRESTLLPFFHLRESANGDLSPKMANPCGGKAAGN